MRIKRVLNNNIVLVNDDKMAEKMLVGRGIGFGKKNGELLDESKIEKIFVLDSPEIKGRFVELIRDIPINHLELTTKIIEQAEIDLGCKFNDTIFLGLADHLNYALYRYKQGEHIKNALQWEIKKFYPNEFQAALQSLKLIQYDEGIKLDEDEASFLALHFVNGQQNSDVKEISEIMEIIQDVLNVVKFHFGIELNDESLNYMRFVTHIRFFLQRVRQQHRDETDDFLYNQVAEKYPEIYKCAAKISKYFQSKMKIELTHNEMLYFMLHIKRLTEQKNRDAGTTN